MKKNTRKILSLLTALLLMNAANTYVIKRTRVINATAIQVDGETIYMASMGILYGTKEIINSVKQIDSRLAKEDYLLEDNAYNNSLKETPKIKSKK